MNQSDGDWNSTVNLILDKTGEEPHLQSPTT